MIEIDRDQRCGYIFEDAFELLLRSALHCGIDLFDRCLAARHKGEINHRHIRRWDSDRGAVEFARKFREHQTDGLGGAR